MSPPIRSAEAPAAAAASPAAPAVSEEESLLLAQLLAMGFSANRAKRALHCTGHKNVDVAINWISSHALDADLDDPWTPPKLVSSTLPAAAPARASKTGATLSTMGSEVKQTEEMAAFEGVKELDAPFLPQGTLALCAVRLCLRLCIRACQLHGMCA